MTDIVVNPLANEQAVSSAQQQKLNKTSRQNLASLGRYRDIWTSLALLGLYVGIFLTGRQFWDERYYVPEEGFGYYLGMTGGIMMLFAFSYGIIKHQGRLRRSGWLAKALRTHIVFGILGPLLVLVHSAFFIGSINGGVALVSMSLVFLSGVVGRYFYTRIHFAINHTKADFQTLRELFESQKHQTLLNYLPQGFEQTRLQACRGFWSALQALVFFRIQAWWLWRQVRAQLGQQLRRSDQFNRRLYRHQKRVLKRDLTQYLFYLRKLLQFSVYERIFYFWRHAHVPLLILLFVSGVVHVVAVHMY
ncbi:MAG: hypothetical protein OEZ58_15430 [Gammaproteobacteria bacterium]|nr:hypothetical protein [Gammaproteobacteria bacterium]MDH5730387.1 hypothetical protein [Gammaproteobacteria bacterium]